MKNESLLPNKDSSNRNTNKYYYDLSFQNSKSNRKSRKVSISSIEDQISELDSCIEELYKIYSERKKIRLNKEKISQNMINRINYLTLEERKIRNMLEKQIIKNKRSSNEKWRTTNNTLKSSPKTKNKRTKSVENLKESKINNKIKILSEIKKDKLFNRYNKDSNNSNNTTKNKDENHKNFILETNIIDKKSQSNNNSIYTINTHKNQNKQNITNNIYIIINRNNEKNKNDDSRQKYTYKNITTINDQRNLKNIQKYKINKNSNTYLIQKGKCVLDSPNSFDEKDCVKVIKEQKSQIKYLEKKLELKKDIMNTKDFDAKNKEKPKKFFFDIFNICNNSNKKIKNANKNNNKIKVKTLTKMGFSSSPLTPENKKYKNILNKTKVKQTKNNSSYKYSIERKKEIMGLKLNVKENMLITKKIRGDLLPKRYFTFENEKHVDDYEKDNDDDNIVTSHNDTNVNKGTEELKKQIKLKKQNKNHNVFNNSVKDHQIKIVRKINTPINKLKTTNKKNKNKMVNSQININHNMIKKLFKQNKKNESKSNNGLFDINYFRKDKKINNSAVKNEISTIRRINLKIQNLKQNHFFNRKKSNKNNETEGITVKRLKNIKKKPNNKSISEKCSKNNLSSYYKNL